MNNDIIVVTEIDIKNTKIDDRRPFIFNIKNLQYACETVQRAFHGREEIILNLSKPSNYCKVNNATQIKLLIFLYE